MRLKLLLTIVVGIGISSACQSVNSDQVAQAQTTRTPLTVAIETGYSDNEPSDRGKADGTASELLPADTSLAKILEQPAPQVWLVFDCQETQENCIDGKMKGELPAETKPLIEKFWRGSLKYIYNVRMKKYDDAKEMIKETDAHFGRALQLTKELQNYTVETPNGSRKISKGEAEDIGGLVVEGTRQTIVKPQVEREDN